MPDSDTPAYAGLQFQAALYGAEKVPQHYVIRAYLDPAVTQEQAKVIKDSLDGLMTSQVMADEVPAEGFCSVVRSRTAKCYTIQLNRTVPLDQQQEAKIAAAAMTLVCETLPGEIMPTSAETRRINDMGMDTRL